MTRGMFEFVSVFATNQNDDNDEGMRLVCVLIYGGSWMEGILWVQKFYLFYGYYSMFPKRLTCSKLPIVLSNFQCKVAKLMFFRVDEINKLRSWLCLSWSFDWLKTLLHNLDLLSVLIEVIVIGCFEIEVN